MSEACPPVRRPPLLVPHGLDPGDLAALAATELFDAAWYAARNPDVSATGMDPAAHYLWLGARLGRSPGPGFDAAAYLALNSDVAQAGANPLLHYLRHGREEGRWAVPVAAPPPLAGTGDGGRWRPRLNWVTNPDNAGWAYGNNARALAAQLPQFAHVFDDTGAEADCALYFDIRVFQMRGRLARRNVLRVGGPRPIALAYGEDRDRLRADLAAFDAVIVLNRALLALIAPLHGQVHLIPNALDLDLWPAAPPRPAGAPFVAGFAGNLSTARERAIKGFDLAQAACTAAGVTLIHFGKGEGQIPRDEMQERFYGAIDCLIHPVGPGKEGCSNVIMEAMAKGVPVITTRDAGFHAELAAEGEGLVFAPRDEAALAAALAALRADPDRARAIGRAGRRFAQAHHDIRRTAPLYGRVLMPAGPGTRALRLQFLPFWEPVERFASSRLRCAQPAAILEDSPGVRPLLGSSLGSCDAVLVSQLASDATMQALAAQPALPVIYDVCDRYFEDDRLVGGVHAQTRFAELAARASVITVPTLALKRRLAALGLAAPVVHLPDGIDYRGRNIAAPSSTKGPAVWFGNPGRGNFDSARWMIDHLRARAGARGVRLISRKRHFLHLAAEGDAAMADYAAICTDWDPDRFIADLRGCSLCLMSHSPEEDTKSPNRLVTAIANGVPVVVSGAPSCAAILQAGGMDWAVVGDGAGLDAAMARLADKAERRRYLNRMQALIEEMFGDAALRARYEALIFDHVAPAGAPTGAPTQTPARPRVLFVSHNLNQGEGAPTSLLQTVTGLAAAGAVTPAVFAVMEGELGAAYQAAGIPLIVPDVGRRSRLAAQMIAKSHDQMARAFAETLAQVQPDLVVVNTAAALWFANLAQEAGLPTIAMIRESSTEHVGFTFGPPSVMAACLRGLTGADRVVFVSDHTRRLWLDSHPLAQPVLIPNGIDLGAFAADRQADRAALRTALGLEPDDLVALSVGSINPRKAQIDIVQALAALPAAVRDGGRARLRLVLVGARPGPYLDDLQAVIAGLDPALAARIRIEPETDTVGRWYRAADLFVFASRNESYPRVIIEAMSFGLPILSSAVFGTREQIVEGESGLMFPPGDVGALAEALQRLLVDDSLRARLAQGALDRVWALVSYPEMVHRYAVQIGQVLAGRAPVLSRGHATGLEGAAP